MARGCVLLFILLLCIGIVAVIYHLGTEVGSVQVTVKAPNQVVANQPFTVEITIENVSLDPVKINGIGLDKKFLKSVKVVSSDPAYRATKDRNYPLYGNWREFELDRELEGGKKLIITLTMEATRTGDYNGEVSVWVSGKLLVIPLSRAQRTDVRFTSN